MLFYIFKGFGKVEVQEMRPNDARCIIWAISMSFYFISCFISINNCTIYVFFMFLRALGRVAEETGPNNVSGIFWAISKFFFFNFSYLINSNSYI